jgi:hypothetical protein
LVLQEAWEARHWYGCLEKNPNNFVIYYVPVEMKFVIRYVEKCLSTIIILLVTISFFLVLSCKRDNNSDGPDIRFITGGNYFSKDTVLKAGDPFLIGIIAEFGDNDLTNFRVMRSFEGGQEIIVDTGIHNEVFEYHHSMSKGVHPVEVWNFRIMDEEGLWSEISFILRNDTTAGFDSITYYPSVLMGTQQSTDYGSFYDLKNNVVYFQDEAFTVQDSIEMLYYYDPTGDANTIASPNANVDTSIYTGATGLQHWTYKNETRYFETSLSTAQFDAIINDSLIIASYDQLNAKRKAKNLVPGEIYSFKTAHGKFGLFKTVNVIGAETGSIEISIKLQK